MWHINDVGIKGFKVRSNLGYCFQIYSDFPNIGKVQNEIAGS